MTAIAAECSCTDRRQVLVMLAAAAIGARAGVARAETADMEAAIKAFAKGAPITPGKVKIDISPLVENGNSASMGVFVNHPQNSQAFVRRIAVFNEKNPQPEVAVFHLNPRSGSSRVDTRIRLATTQHLAAVAELSDGTFWSDQVEVIITIAACLEE
jgi:sulfur-oxidizing protein SoxY